MKTQLIAIMLFLVFADPASAQDHLVPDVSALVDPDRYLLKIRHIFATGFEHDVAVRAVVLRSFEREYLVGVQFGDSGAQTFVQEASTSIWDTELLEMYKTGEIGPATTLDGKLIPLERDKEYQALKQRTPADYRDIKAIRRARPLPRDLADGIKTLWAAMLVDVRHPKGSDAGLDGVTYHFSAWIQGRGDLSGHIWTPKPESKAGQLSQLAESLADFARGTGTLKTVTTRFEAARKSIAATTP
jgi:hypothetical protein